MSKSFRQALPLSRRKKRKASDQDLKATQMEILELQKKAFERHIALQKEQSMLNSLQTAYYCYKMQKLGVDVDPEQFDVALMTKPQTE